MIVLPAGEMVVTGTAWKPALRQTASEPSPPSAIGTVITSAAGTASVTPTAIAAAASLAVRLPRNLSGATSTLGRLGRVIAARKRVAWRRALPMLLGLTVAHARRSVS